MYWTVRDIGRTPTTRQAPSMHLPRLVKRATGVRAMAAMALGLLALAALLHPAAAASVDMDPEGRKLSSRVSPSLGSLMIEWGRIREVFTTNLNMSYWPGTFTPSMLKLNTLKVGACVLSIHSAR